MPRTSTDKTNARHPRRRALAALFGLCLVGLPLLSGARALADTPPPFQVIVHPKNPLSSASKDLLTDAFLKRKTQWDHGEAIRPVDLRADSATRRKFSEVVLRRSVEAVRSYWQQRVFSGRGVPPPELDSDQAVVDYVLKYPGAVGYVSGSASLREAKVVAVR
jgi:ABC-type phosphate transport system substrate-binding protein